MFPTDLPPLLPPLRLVGADILRDGALRQRSLGIARGRITRGPLPAVDMSGYWLLPGIVDLMSLSIDRAEPPSLAHVAQEAARAGITTQYLSLGWSWEPARSPARAVAWLLQHKAQAARLPVDLRIQLAAETHLPDHGPALLEAVRDYDVSCVSFTSRAEQVMEANRTNPTALDSLARIAGLDPERPALILDAAAMALSQARGVPRHLCQMAEAFDAAGVTYASRGDSDGERREFFSMLGARIAECPASHSAAAVAKAMGETVLIEAAAALGPAPPAETSRPRRGAEVAQGILAAGLCDALVSANATDAPLRAVRDLVRAGADLVESWDLVSSRPAEIMRLVDRGRLDHGARADVIALNPESWEVEMTLSQGRLAHISGQAKVRMQKALGGLAAQARVAAE